MAASEEQIAKIQEILQHLDEHLQTPKSDNRRAPRMNVRMTMWVTLLSGAEPAPVQIFSRNLSVSGIGFVSRRMFGKEERIAVTLRIPKMTPKLILSRITFARYVNNGMYEMGAEFLESISDPRGQGTIPKQWILKSAMSKATAAAEVAAGAAEQAALDAPAPAEAARA